MKASGLWIAFLAIVPAPEAFAQESRAIFDGQSLDGWEGERGFWSVENGELVGRSTLARPLSHSTWLIWRGGEVADFRLELDFQLIGGNSGVQFRSRDLGDFQVGGYQADLEDGPNWSGCLYEQEGRGVCARRGEVVVFGADGSRTLAQAGDGAKLLERVRARQWNHYTIEARGSSFSLSINGVLMTSVTDLDPRHFAPKGLLAFQLHEGPPMEVRFKNIRLSAFEPAARAASTPADAVERPQWIWTRVRSERDKRAFFERRFELASAPRSARLSGSADNQFQVFVNAAAVLDHDEWQRPVWVDVASRLRAGDNLISVDAKNDGGPAAIQLELDVELEDGTRLRLVTDESWLATDDPKDSAPAGEEEIKPWGHAVRLAPLGAGVWGSLPAAAKYEPPQALAAALIVAPEGMLVELVYTVPRGSQGSWVAMCFDDRGRIIASDQYGSLYRVTLENGAWKKTEPLDLPLGGAQGLCYAFDALYAVVSIEGEGYEPGLWRAKHVAAQDRFDAPELLLKFDGNGEHGPHAVVLSPDKQSLFVVGGNHTKVPAGITRSHVVPSWGEDRLLPQHADPNGHAVGITAPGGWICKTDRGGRRWELFASGFRNAYDMAFDADGEAFTFDSDMEWDIGLPWYRPTMIQHVVPGGDYGWRTGSWRWPAYYPDSLPGVVDIGISSPTGMCFVPQGSAFVTPNQGRLLVGDWAYGKIYSVALAPDGATFSGTFETLVEGKPLPVTDMEFGPDRALYFLVGGRRTQSALYRVSGRAKAAESLATPEASEAGALAKARRVLSGQFGVPTHDDVDDGFDCLDSSDRFLRYAARTVLEHQPLANWADRALKERRPRAAIEGLIAVARRAPSEWREIALDRFDALPLETMDEDRLLASLRALELIFIRLGRPASERAAAIGSRLDELYPNPRTLVNRELCELLVYLESPAVAAKSLELIELAPTREDQIALAWSLKNLRSNWTLDERSRFFHWMNDTTAGWSGGLSFSKYLDQLRDDAIATLSVEERRLLGELLDKPRAVEAAANAGARELVRHWTVDELLAGAAQSRQGRDFGRGERVYREARCHDCHRIANFGGGSGPDLTGASSRFGDRDLLEALLEPSKTVSDQYQDAEVLTTDDRLHVGRVARLANGDVRIFEIDARAPREIPAAEVVSVRPYKLSRMPAGLLDTFHEDELIDLIAYLRSGADPKDAAFEQQ